MSKTLSRSYFQKRYLQRIAAGELFIPEPESPAVDMFIAELNKFPKGDADFSVYKFEDVEWNDFLGDIFSSEEYRDHTKTGFEYRAIAEDACAQTLRSFIGKIKQVYTKLTLLKFFMTDDFRQNVLSKSYCAYGASADMIQLQCAKLMGEITRSYNTEVAPDLADIADDLTKDAGDEPVNNEQDIKKIIASWPTKKMVVNGKVMEIYQLPKDEGLSPVAQLIASVNRGEVQARRADWKLLVQEGFRAEQTTPMPFMYWMQECLTNIKVRDYRIDALHTILENLPTYLHEVGASDDVLNRYKQDCKNLLHYFRQIIYIIRYFDEAGRYWNEHRDEDQFDVEAYLYFRFIDRIDDLKEYMAFTQAYYIAYVTKTPGLIPKIIAAQSEQYWDQLVTKDIIGFCSSLYFAETARQKFLASWERSFSELPFDRFNCELRNHCFDFYIEHRIEDIRAKLSEDILSRYAPSTQACYQLLLDTDTHILNSFKNKNYLQGSEASAPIEKSEASDIFAMADLFLQYLAEKLPPSSNTDLETVDELGIIHVPASSKEEMESYYSKPFCDFNFLNHEFQYDYPGSPYRNNWLWKDKSGDITFSFKEMEHITDTLPSPQTWEVKKWLRMYLKAHPSVTVDMLDEVYGEIERLVSTYLGEYLRREKNGLWGIEYGGSYDNVYSRIGLDVWKEVLVSNTSVSPAPSTVSVSQEENKHDCRWNIVDMAFNFSHTIQELVIEMANTCTKPWHFACMIAVLDDYNLVKDRSAYTAISDALAEWDIKVNPNSMGYKLSNLPTDFHSWNQKTWKKEYNKCVAMETSISSRNGYTYRHKKS